MEDFESEKKKREQIAAENNVKIAELQGNLDRLKKESKSLGANKVWIILFKKKKMLKKQQ